MRTVLWAFSQIIYYIYFKSSWQGAQTNIYCCLEDGLINGEYYSDCRVGGAFYRNKQISDPKLAAKLWQFSEDLLKPYLD